MEENKNKNKNAAITLSVAKKNYDGANNIWFESKPVLIKDLETTLKTYNYSTIKWKDGNRKASNFQSAVGFIADIDNGLSIHDAEERLKKRDLNYLIIPSKSHSSKQHRFHILIPFNRIVYSQNTYKQIANGIIDNIFPESDKSVTDAARYIYGSPDNVNLSSNFSDKDYCIDDLGELWDSSLEFTNANDDVFTVKDIDEKDKTAIYCPFHDDQTPSAFVNYSQDSHNWFIHCSACGNTFWMEKSGNPLETLTEPFWSYGTDVYEFGIANDEFFFERIGEKKFYHLTKSDRDKEDSKRAYKYLVQHKHIRHISEINYIGDISVDHTHFTVDKDDGLITVHHAAIPVKIQDNQLIEDYLEDRFGKRKDFIKEWLAMYVYTNYVKLPTIIIKSNRGCGKSTFVEVVGEIYKPLTYNWNGHEQNFTYEAEKKLLVVEENEQEAQHQYKTLKKYSGQKYSRVEKKFKDPFQVLNNMNIILLANDSIPVYVTRDERPSSELNNQFFVYEFLPIAGTLDVNIQRKLEDRLGHYIRTELKIVFDNINSTGCRYGIKVPITNEEKALFADSITDLDAEADEFIRIMIDYDKPLYGTDNFKPFLDKHLVPDKFFKQYDITTKSYNRIVKNLKRRGYLCNGEVERVKIGKYRFYCNKMTDKLINKIQKSKDCAQVAQKGDCNLNQD